MVSFRFKTELFSPYFHSYSKVTLQYKDMFLFLFINYQFCLNFFYFYFYLKHHENSGSFEV